MTERTLRNAIDLANKELRKCHDYLKDNSNAWKEVYDLKLHDASLMDSDDFTFKFEGATITFDDEYINKAFCSWCEIEYDAFIEWCDYEGIAFDKMIDRIGRTSKFYLGGLHDCSFEEVYEMTSCSFYHSLIVLENDGTIKRDETIREYNGDLDALCEDLLAIVRDMYDELTYVVDDCIKVSQYIEGFKKSQCVNFKQFVIDNWKSLVFDDCIVG